MTARRLSLVLVLLLTTSTVGSIDVAAAGPKKPPKPPPTPPPPTSTSEIFVRTYADVRNGVKCDMTPQDITATADGGYVMLGHTAGPGCDAVSWLAKVDKFGTPVWQQEIGCGGLPSGGFDLGLALRGTPDGGFVIAGGVRDCEANPVCPYLGSVQCGLVEKLDAAGRLVWKRVYRASPSVTSLEDIAPTSDGGFVAVGSVVDANGDIGALVLKLDGQGRAQWQRTIGPAGRTHALLNAVRQTPDGGYVAAGETYTAISGLPPTSVLAVKLDADGNVRWQRGFNSRNANGEPTATEHALAMTTTSDGGVAIAGAWRTLGPNTCCQGILLLELDASGESRSQKAYSGGVHCFFNGYWTQCAAIGGLGYSVHQLSDGGFALAGAGHLKLRDSVPLVPWLARTDAAGALAWQQFYYLTHPSTGRPLSQYFASAVPAAGGYAALGSTGSATDLKTELLLVRTDGGGQVGGCGQIHPATPLDALDPGLMPFAPGLPVTAPAAIEGDLPGRITATSSSAVSGGGC